MKSTFLLMLMCIASPLSSSSTQDRDRLFIWGFDRLAVSSLDQTDVRDLVSRGRLQNIVAVSGSGNLLSVVARPADAHADGLSLVAVDATTGDIRETLEMPGLVRASISPDGTMVGVVTCAGAGCRFKVIQRATGRAVTTETREAASSGTVAWDPSSTQVAFDAPGQVTTVLSVANGATFRVNGSSPAWKPDGLALAVIDGRSVGLIDMKTRGYTQVATRHFWQTKYVAPLAWRGDGTVLLANASAGATGYRLDCLMVDVSSGKVRTVFSGELHCGPWR